jgi:hypothetical protein
MENNRPPVAVRRVLIIWGEPEWTEQALHLACALVSRGRGEVVLAKMIPVVQPLLLGADDSGRRLSRPEHRALAEHNRTALSYEAALRLTTCQFSDWRGGLLSLARRYRPLTLFCAPRHSTFPALARLSQWWLRRGLERAGCQLETLEPPAGAINWVPSVSLERRSAPGRPGFNHQRDISL